MVACIVAGSYSHLAIGRDDGHSGLDIARRALQYAVYIQMEFAAVAGINQVGPVIAHAIVIVWTAGYQEIPPFTKQYIHSGAKRAAGICMNNIMRAGVIHLGKNGLDFIAALG